VNGTSYGEYERGRADSAFQMLNRFLIFAIILGVCVGGVIMSVPIIKQYREQSEKISRLQTELAREKAVYSRRNREEQLLKNDPTYLEIVSRDRLDVMKPGETIIHLDPPKTTKN
jgi:cell division protein FtsB